MKLTVKKNNIFYMQDFSFFKGVPEGKYDVKIQDNKSLRLTSPGYGDLSSYGNGPIFIKYGHLPEDAKKFVDDYFRNKYIKDFEEAFKEEKKETHYGKE